MSPQVFRGRTVLEAHRTALEQLGPEAVVLTTRSVSGRGIRGWFGATEVEIAATVPERMGAMASVNIPFAPGAYRPAVASPAAATADVVALRAELKGDIRSLKTLIVSTHDSGELASEIAQLRELVQEMAGEKPRRGDKTNAQLRSVGVEGAALTAIARELKGKAETRAALREALGKEFRVADWPIDDQRTMIAVVGPSGVGKTTTAAKLGARARLEGKSVTFVACDEVRVGAVEQLSRYADMMGAELAVARTADELNRIIDEATTDVVIVDTSGRPPVADGVEIALIPSRRDSRASARARHVLLCVPATVRSHDALRIARRYAALSPSALCVTKIDETDTPAGIVHAAWAAKLPVAVLCFGQRVPEDIAPASIEAMVDYVAPRSGSGAAA